MAKGILVAVSGGFDPVHKGHIQMFLEAKKLGDKLVVILNSDDWLKRKKGKAFMSEEERAFIIEQLKPVDAVYIHHSDNDDVASALKYLKPDIFANGGDRKEGNTPEKEVCDELGIQMVFGVGGEKIQSSSKLLNDHKSNFN